MDANGCYDNETSHRLGFRYGRKMLQVSDRWESLDQLFAMDVGYFV